MDKIITDLYEIMKHSLNPMDTEKEIQNYMWQTFSEIMGEVLEKVNQIIKENKQAESWKVQRNDLHLSCKVKCTTSNTIDYYF